MRVGGFGLQRDGALQVRQRRRQIALLAEHEAEQVVRLRMIVVEAQRLGELLAARRSVRRARRRPARARSRSSAGLVGRTVAACAHAALCCFRACPSA